MHKITIPEFRHKEKYFLKEMVAMFLITIFFLSGITILAYWYLFGFSNPFEQKKLEDKQNKPYVFPKYQLNNLIKEKLFSPLDK
jgi:hypothetical protein